jgi:hypothetical protein
MKIGILLTFFVIVVNGFTQNFSDRVGFIKYLLEKELYDEAIIESKNVKQTFVKISSIEDSLNYFLGKSYFTKNKDSSLHYFSKVNDSRLEVFFSARLFSSFLNFEKKKYLECDKELASMKNNDRCMQQMIKFASNIMQEKSIGIDYGICDDQIYEYEFFQELKDKLITKKNRSPFVGGLLSAVVPGLGKVYAKKPRQGLSFFVVVSLLGYQTFEAYKIGGSDDLRFITFGSLFSLFYVGNVWGSVLSVKINRQEIYEETHNNIIATMRIPVNRIFKGN